MIRRKRGVGMVAHAALVLATALRRHRAQWDRWEIYALAAAHVAIDAAKAALPAQRRESLGAFLADQAAHLLTLGIVAGLAPDLWAGGLWAGLPWLPGAMALAAGAILATRTGGFAVGLLMRRFGETGLPAGLPDGGLIIGLLERGLIYHFRAVGRTGRHRFSDRGEIGPALRCRPRQPEGRRICDHRHAGLVRLGAGGRLRHPCADRCASPPSHRARGPLA
jgi:hypothetical protein